jgi:hypothetical protein
MSPSDHDVIKAFLAAQCVAVPGGSVRYRLLYESFLSWLPAGSWWPIQRFGHAIDRAGLPRGKSGDGQLAVGNVALRRFRCETRDGKLVRVPTT